MAIAGYGRLYVEAGAAAQALNATPDTFDKLTCFTTDGIAYKATVANATDNITAPEGGGDPMPALVNFSVSFTVSAAGLYRFAVYKDGAVVAGTERRLTCALTTTYTVSGSSLASVTSGSAPVFDLRAASDQVSPNITVSYGSFEVRT